MLIIQILLTAFFLFAVYRVILRYTQKDLHLSALIGWLIFWLAGIVVVVFPDTTFYFAKLVGIGRGADLVVYIAIALLFYIIFRLMVRIERLEKNLTKVVRTDAIKKI